MQNNETEYYTLLEKNRKRPKFTDYQDLQKVQGFDEDVEYIKKETGQDIVHAHYNGIETIVLLSNKTFCTC